jgi:YjbE family integral membrane protein
VTALNLWRQGSQQVILLGYVLGRHAALRLEVMDNCQNYTAVRQEFRTVANPGPLGAGSERAAGSITSTMDIFSASFFTALLEIMLINIVLSGDNAVVIALAARNLPPRQRMIAMLWGSGGAIVLRILLTIVAVQLLKIPLLQSIGAAMLVWIAIKLLVEEDQQEGEHHAHGDLFSAVRTILIADVVMSLDNTLAIAGVAKGNWTLLVAGLLLSIPLIVFGSTLLMKLMDRYPVVVYVGAGLIAWTAGEMFATDPVALPYLPQVFQHTHYLALLLTAGCIGFGWWYNLRKGRDPHAVLDADVHAAQRIDDKIE